MEAGKKAATKTKSSLKLKHLDYNWRKPRALFLVSGGFGCFFYALYKDVKVPYYTPKYTRVARFKHGEKIESTQWLVKLDNRIKNKSFLPLSKTPRYIRDYVQTILRIYKELEYDDLPNILK